MSYMALLLDRVQATWLGKTTRSSVEFPDRAVNFQIE